MDTIGEQKIWSWLDGSSKIETASCSKVRNGRGFLVHDYLELATRIAEIHYRNKDYMFLYRGQNKDHKNRIGNSSFQPNIFRQDENSAYKLSIHDRYKLLNIAQINVEKTLRNLKIPGFINYSRHILPRWAILQHYEICDTPLLDVTQSLRVAASFASIKADDEAFVYMLGVPNLSGAITASADAGLQIIRLSSVCPPQAVRPHIQEGYLLSEYPEITGGSQKEQYENYEVDFGRRLVAKFRFDPRSFWKPNSFQQIPELDLYPDANDPFVSIANSIKLSLKEA